MLVKVCNKCAIEKPLSKFPINSKGKHGRGQSCNECSAKISAKYLKENYAHVYALKFKADVVEIESVLARTCCDICGAPPKKHKRNSIGHCHVTGKIRGLLCDDCNTGIGKLKDSPALLQKAKEYLENSKH